MITQHEKIAIQQYEGLLTQQLGTATIIVLNNTLGDIVWTWDNTNKRTIGTLTNAFPENKVIIQMGTDPANAVWFTAQRATDNTIWITASFDFTTFLPEADALNNTPITIKIFNNV